MQNTLLTDYKLLVYFLTIPYIFLTSFVKSFYNWLQASSILHYQLIVLHISKKLCKNLMNRLQASCKFIYNALHISYKLCKKFLSTVYKFLNNALDISYKLCKKFLWNGYRLLVNFLTIPYIFLASFAKAFYECLKNFLWMSFKLLTNVWVNSLLTSYRCLSCFLWMPPTLYKFLKFALQTIDKYFMSIPRTTYELLASFL